MAEKNEGTRIRYDRPGFLSAAGHTVRSSIEASVCDWLMAHRIAHRHATEMFAVRPKAHGTPRLYVPDILLHDPHEDGRTIIIEVTQLDTPKSTGSGLVAAFRREMKDQYVVIMVAKLYLMKKLLKDAYDVLINADNLDDLAQHIPFPEL
jgi:hypothetical protein